MPEPSAMFDPRPAAAALADAWRTGRLLRELPAPIRPRTLTDGYDLQDRLIELLDQPAAGWKLGLGSALQKWQSGAGRSIGKPFDIAAPTAQISARFLGMELRFRTEASPNDCLGEKAHG